MKVHLGSSLDALFCWRQKNVGLPGKYIEGCWKFRDHGARFEEKLKCCRNRLIFEVQTGKIL
jgi:hypothetical protein